MDDRLAETHLRLERFELANNVHGWALKHWRAIPPKAMEELMLLIAPKEQREPPK